MVVRDLLVRARMLTTVRRYAEAERLLAQVLAAEPDNENGLFSLSVVLNRQGRRQEADAALERLLRAHPDSRRGLTTMARRRCLQRRQAEGLSFARRAAELYPDNVEALETLAEVLRQVTPGSAEAVQVARRALEIDPERVWAHRVLADVHMDLGQYADAERSLLRALAIAPQDPFTMIRLGMARAGLGRFDESREQVSAVLRMDARPGMIADVVAYIERRAIPDPLADIYRMALAALGRPDVSQPDAAGSDPGLIAAQGKLARRMYSRHAGAAGRRRAGELAAAVLAADPGNADARYVRSRTLVDEGRHTGARPIADG